MSISFRPLPLSVLLFSIAASVSAGEIRGRVLVDGKPAASVTVAVLPFEDGFEEARREARREGPPQALASATTRADGSFAVAVAAAPGTSVRLGFSGGTAAPRVLEALFDAAGDDAGEVRLPRAAALAGRVVDERGGPVVGAAVTLWPGGERRLQDASPARGEPQQATTKADGTFRFESASADSNRLRVEAPAFATLERQPVRAGAVARPLVLSLGQVRRGTVTLADRRTPAKGALVRFEGRTQTTRWVETRPDGSFLAEGAPREPGSLVADGGERGRASAVLTAGPSEPVTIALAPTATLAGRVVEADAGKPLAGIRLVARGEDAVFQTRSLADGRYAFRGLGPRRYRLSAEDDRFVPWTRSVSVVAGQAETQDVPLARAATLAGRVVNEDGAPIEGARVRLARGGENVFRAFMRSMQEEQAVRTGRDGSFRATRLAAGDNQRLDVRHDDYEERAISGIALTAGATRSGLSVVMRRGLSLRGIVKDEEGRPLAGCEVNLSAGRSIRAGRGGMQMQLIGPGNQVRRETAADGRFEFRGLKAGEYSLVARRPGFSRASVDPVNVSEAKPGEPLELTLRPGSTISGVLRDKAGNGASGWFVSARPAGQGGGVPMGPGANRTEEPTGPDGAFLLEGLLAGEAYELQVMGQAGLGPRRSGVTAPAEGIDLVVNGTGQVRGRVADADSGRAIADFQLRYQPDAQGGMRFMMRAGPGGGRGPYERQPFHAEDGSFVLEDVPAGRWTVEAEAPGYQTGSASAVSVVEGEATEGVEVRLSKGGVVTGRVLESRSGRPILDATVRAEQSGGEPRMGMLRIGGEGGDNEAATDADGRYELAGLAPGTWIVTASHAGLERGDRERRAQGRARHSRHPARPRRLGRRIRARGRPPGGRRPGDTRRRGRQRYAARDGLHGRRRAERPQRRGRALPFRPAHAGALQPKCFVAGPDERAGRGGGDGRRRAGGPAHARRGRTRAGRGRGPARRAAHGRERERPGPGLLRLDAHVGRWELRDQRRAGGDAHAARERGRLPHELALGIDHGHDRSWPGGGHGRDPLRAGLPGGRTRHARRPAGARRDGDGVPRRRQPSQRQQPHRRDRRLRDGRARRGPLHLHRDERGGRADPQDRRAQRRHECRPRGAARAPRRHGGRDRVGPPARRRERPHRGRRRRHALRQHGLDRQLRPLRLRGHGGRSATA